jgi:DHA2 family multidrug resistance protein
MGNDFEWLVSPFLTGVLVTVLVALPCFIIWEMAERHPALDIRLFSHRNFTIGIICSMLGFLSIQGLLALFAVHVQLLLGYSSSLAGLVFMTMIILPVPIVAVVHELMKEIDAWIGVFDRSSYFRSDFLAHAVPGLFCGHTFRSPGGDHPSTACRRGLPYAPRKRRGFCA